MAKCVACKTTILFGGMRDGVLRYCNVQCQNRGRLLASASELPEDMVRERVQEVHCGECPGCGGRGPVDVHTGYRVWSALLLTSWRSLPHISCRSCARKSLAFDTLYSLVLGWWAFPWGFIVTPVQVVRNIGALLRGPDPRLPSAQLEDCVRVALAFEDQSAKTRQAES